MKLYNPFPVEPPVFGTLAIGYKDKNSLPVAGKYFIILWKMQKNCHKEGTDMKNPRMEKVCFVWILKGNKNKLPCGNPGKFTFCGYYKATWKHF